MRDEISTENNNEELVSIAEEAGFHPSSEDIWLYEDRNFKRKAALRGCYFLNFGSKHVFACSS
ncbi:hypothetical protein [Synechococcus sp. WH 8020]|uniref:hypothetical protein n=1 Tax=Synechococcus sp. (strain WH8020) TaxID=32052 RepID=UPI0008FF9458|nr:hypothetical protein [Synechococcus sp. WH 8020]